MSEYYMSHSGSQLDEAISKVKNGYILPSGTIPITSNGTVDVKNYETASVKVSELTRRTSGAITLSDDIYGGTTDLSNAQLSVDIGFVPKFFIFRPYSNDAAATCCRADSSRRTVLDSVNFYDGFCDGINERRVTSFLDYNGKNGGIQVNGIGFYRVENSTQVYFYCPSTLYVIHAGEWYWEAYA